MLFCTNFGALALTTSLSGVSPDRGGIHAHFFTASWQALPMQSVVKVMLDVIVGILASCSITGAHMFLFQLNSGSCLA